MLTDQIAHYSGVQIRHAIYYLFPSKRVDLPCISVYKIKVLRQDQEPMKLLGCFSAFLETFLSGRFSLRIMESKGYGNCPITTKYIVLRSIRI